MGELSELHGVRIADRAECRCGHERGDHMGLVAEREGARAFLMPCRVAGCKCGDFVAARESR